MSRLDGFGFRDGTRAVPGPITAALLHGLSRNLAVGVQAGLIDARRMRREVLDVGGRSTDDTFEWFTVGGGLVARLMAPSPDDTFAWFLEGRAGASRASSRLVVRGAPREESDWGYLVGAAAGALILPSGHFGLHFRFSYTFAPAMDNLVEDTHNSGGLAFEAGMRVMW
jgi:hypothetical protein